MQIKSKILDDAAKVANGVVTSLVGVKDEINGRVRDRVEALFADMDLVTREEFEVARAMAAKARDEQERLNTRIAALEALFAQTTVKPATGKPAPRSPRPGDLAAMRVRSLLGAG